MRCPRFVRRLGMKIRVRQRCESADTARYTDDAPAIDALRSALEVAQGPEWVLEWSGTWELAALDLDWHHCPAPGNVLVAPWRPQPIAQWRTRSGGLRQIFQSGQGFRANELAALAAIAGWRHFNPKPSVEVINRTRAPGAYTEIHPQVIGQLRSHWMRTGAGAVSEPDIMRELNRRNWSIGNRVLHEQCVIDPRPNSKGDTPVVITDNGVMCYVCAAQGSDSGFRSWAWICGGKRRESPLISAVKAAVAWEQAQYLMIQMFPLIQVKILKAAYAALLKIFLHPDDPRIPLAMQTHYLVRRDGNLWVDSRSFEPINRDPSPAVLRRMPSVQYVREPEDDDDDDEWTMGVDPKLLDLHRTDQPIPGFPIVFPIHGSKVWGVWLDYPDDGLIRVVRPFGEANGLPPRYLHKNERFPIEVAWEKLEQSFPGIDRSYALASLISRGYAESGTGPVPLILAVGPTGAAKTTTPMVSAMICGDDATVVKADALSKFSEELGYRSLTASFLLADEFAKDAAGVKSREAFNWLLTVNRRYEYRKLHHGPTRVRFNNVIIITNTGYPDEVYQHAQFARRAAFVKLWQRTPARWEETCGTGDVTMWRTVPENAKVADTILSHIVDEHFSDEPVVWQEKMREIGVPMLEDFVTQEGELQGEVIVNKLFELVCSSDNELNSGHFRGRGWKEVTPDSYAAGDELSEYFFDACSDSPENRSPARWARATMLDELDIGRALGLDLPVECQRKRHGHKLGIRFVSGSGRGRKINQEIST